MYSNKKKTKSSNKETITEINFHGAAIIDEKGREIAITEDMVQNAFDKLAQIAMLPHQLRYSILFSDKKIPDKVIYWVFFYLKHFDHIID